VAIRCTVHSAAHIAQVQTKSNFSMIEKKTLKKRRGSQRFWVQRKGSAATERLKTTVLDSHLYNVLGHCYQISHSQDSATNL